MRTPVLLALALLMLGLTGCGDGTEGSADAGVDAGPITPTDLVAGTWNEIRPGGDTLCARGTPYAFFVYPGTTNKVVIDFMGGGACWTEESCGFAGALFDDSVDTLRNRTRRGFPGIYDKTKASPVKDWWHIVVPYCTGDIHWGNNVVHYGAEDAGVTIRHKGAVNSRAVLDWLFANFRAPERLMVQGCSAGAYGAIYWTPHIAHHYPNVPLAQLGDSGAGIITPTFFKDSFPKWNATAAAPTFVDSLNPAKVDWLTLELPDLYGRVGVAFPGVQLAQFNTEFDGTQKFFLEAMGGDPATWSPKMRSSLDKIRTMAPSFANFLGPGNQHCVIPDDDFSTFTSGGTKFVDWYGALVEGKPLPQVRCTDCDAGP